MNGLISIDLGRGRRGARPTLRNLLMIVLSSLNSWYCVHLHFDFKRASPIKCIYFRPNFGPRLLTHPDGMKLIVSIPDVLFEKVERFARRTKRSHSEVFTAALREYIAHHASDGVTEAINQAVEEIGAQADEFVATASRHVLAKTEW